MPDFDLTAPQREFVEHKDGNILVSASAGSGKTSTMIRKLTDMIAKGCNVRDFLVVTYTNASACEMKQKLYLKLSEKLSSDIDESVKDHISNQIDDLNNSDIGTLHSVCKKIISKYFYAVDVDPAFKLITGKEQTYLFDVALNNVFDKLVADDDKDFFTIYTLYNNKRNLNDIKFIVTKLYEFCLSKTDYNEWKGYVLNKCCDENLETNISAKFLVGYFKNEIERFKDEFNHLKCVNDQLEKKYGEFVGFHVNLVDQILTCKTYKDMCICANTNSIPSKPRVNNKDVDEKVYNEQLASLAGEFKDIFENFKNVFVNYTASNMQNMRLVIEQLFRLKELVEDEYTRLKKNRNILDFSDLEHKTIEVLKNETIAKEISSKYKYIFVDEYQDINQVQENIISQLGHDNINMIGDLKQSIYQFRLSSPKIFIEKYNRFSKNDGGSVVNLNHNFRSEPNILEFANFVFDELMTKKTIGIDYKTTSRLQAGNKKEPTCVVDVDLLNADEEGETEESEIIANNVVKLVEEGYTYSDIAILLRSKGELAQGIIEKLKEYNIPCDATYKTKLFENNEILVIYSLLKVINNDLDDLALATTLKSIFGGLTNQELANIRANHESDAFYVAVNVYRHEKNDQTKGKLDKFYDFIDDCRFKLNSLTITELLQQIFVKYMVLDYYLSFVDGGVRVSNIKEFLNLISNDEYKYDLKKCLDYLDGLKNEEVTLDVSGGTNSVKIMTIHASKGLEFPAVIVGGMGKSFRINVQTSSLIINDNLGIGVKILDGKNRIKKESLVASACKYQNKIDELNEEIRLLYVALTRAKSRLCLVGSCKLSSLKSKHDLGVYTSKNYMDFMFKALNKSDLNRINSGSVLLGDGANEFRLNVISPAEIRENIDDKKPIILSSADANLLKKMQSFYNFKYPYKQTNVAIKNTVTSVLKEEVDYENKVDNLRELSTMQTNSSDIAMRLGTAYHSIMQNLEYHENKAEICELIEKIQTTDLPYENVDVNKICKAVENVKSLIRDGDRLRKEAQFVMKTNYSKIDKKIGDVDVLIQGVIDLVIEGQNDAIILDFKTNKTSNEKSLKEMYGLQLNMYADAFEKASNKKVVKKYLYSFYMDKLIEC